MKKYTLKGSTELDRQIDADLARIAKVTAPYCRALVLLGGYGRGEGSPRIMPDGSQCPLNDYDLIGLVEHRTRKVIENFQRLEQNLSAELSFHIDLHPYAMNTLPQCEFSLLNYELKYGHQIIRGDQHALDALPNYPHGELPRSEGARLLLNRGKLLLDIQQRLVQPEPLTDEERVRFIQFIFKVLLAFGDCALLINGQYHINASVKKERLPTLGSFPDRDFVVAEYQRAMEFKEWADFQALEAFDIETEFKAVRAVFLRFLPWYRALYSAKECSVPKALALNLIWNKRLDPHHPRERLYDHLTDLLQNKSTLPAHRFYELQRRFS